MFSSSPWQSHMLVNVEIQTAQGPDSGKTPKTSCLVALFLVCLLKHFLHLAGRTALWLSFSRLSDHSCSISFAGSSSFLQTLSMECIRFSFWLGSVSFIFSYPHTQLRWLYSFSLLALSHLIHFHGFKCYLYINDSQNNSSEHLPWFPDSHIQLLTGCPTGISSLMCPQLSSYYGSHPSTCSFTVLSISIGGNPNLPVARATNLRPSFTHLSPSHILLSTNLAARIFTHSGLPHYTIPRGPLALNWLVSQEALICETTP